MKSISLIHFSAPPTVAGVESTIRSHAFAFRKRGFSVEIITGEGKQFDNIPMTVIPLMNAKNKSIMKQKIYLEKGEIPPNFELIRKNILSELKNKIKSDIVIIYNILTIPFNLPLTAALAEYIQETNKKFVYWCFDHAWSNDMFKKYIRNEYPWNLLVLNIKKINYVASSKSRARELSRLSGINIKNIKVLPNGIDIDDFLDLSPLVMELKDKFNLLDGKLNIFMPVRITEKKNIDFAVMVLSKLYKSIPCRLIVSGPLETRDINIKNYYIRLNALISKLRLKKIVLLFHEQGIKCDRKSIQSMYKICDIVFLPSFPEGEGFGLPLYEASIYHKPVLASDINVFREFGRTKVEFFNLSDTPEQVAFKIMKMWKNAKTNKAFKDVICNYSWDSIFDRLIFPFMNIL